MRHKKLTVAEAKERIGKRLKTLHEIRSAARAGKSLVTQVSKNEHGQVSYFGPTPAAFFVNRIGTDICLQLDLGVHLYKPKLRKTTTGIKKGFKN